MYVFVREDLPIPQIAVQSSHACIEATKAFDIASLEDHPSVIIIGIKNEQKLHQVRKYLMESGIRHVHFYETDMDDQLTALATEPVHGERRKLFRKFQLLKDRTPPPVPEPASEHMKYVAEYPDGYYWWAGECGNSPHRTWCLDRAAKYDSEEDARWSNSQAEIIPVRTCYYAGKAGAA